MTPNTVLTNTPATAACRYVDHRRYPAPASAHNPCACPKLITRA